MISRFVICKTIKKYEIMGFRNNVSFKPNFVKICPEILDLVYSEIRTYQDK
jgi:hypothetical protein